MIETMKNAESIGIRVGRAIARDTLADGLDRQWVGLDPQDAGVLRGAGLVCGTPEWEVAEAAAEAEYLRVISQS